MKSKLIFSSLLMSGLTSFSQINQNTSGQTGIGTNAPANRLEVKSTASDPYGSFISTYGASGLRFTYLNSNKTPTVNPSSNVLTVDANGDVILVPDGGGIGTFGGAQNGCSATSGNVVQLGNNFGSTSAALSNNREIPQNNNVILFSGSNTGDRVNFGGNWGAWSNVARVTAENHNMTDPGQNRGTAFACLSNAFQPNENIGVVGETNDFSSAQFATNNIGMLGNAVGKGNQVGVYGRATSMSGTSTDIYGYRSLVGGVNSTSGRAYGFDAYVTSLSTGDVFGVNSLISGENANISYGVKSAAVRSRTNYGGYFNVYNAGGPTGVDNYGVFASATDGSNTNYGIYATAACASCPMATNWAGFMNGNFYYTGAWLPSDRNLKKDIKTVENSLSIIAKLNPVTYNFNPEVNKGLNLPAEKQYGFISQEIQQILPEFTKIATQPETKDANGKVTAPAIDVLSLNYNGFIALLTKGMQEQQQQIDELKKQNAEMSQRLNSSTSINNFNPIETGFQMSQNEPNPFTHETVVKYTLPTTVSNAFMAVYDLTGKQITTFQIRELGSSSITITSEKLAAGIYIYSIVADGKVVDSKRMIVAEK